VSDQQTLESAPANPPRRLGIIQLLALVAGVVVIAAGTLLFGHSSSTVPSGSVAGAIETATEYYRLHGYPTDAISFSAQISPADKYWARFSATPVVAGAGTATYGYENFAVPHWVVVSQGDHQQVCATGGVPAAVMASFGDVCVG
jgi:hypothetical protein